MNSRKKEKVLVVYFGLKDTGPDSPIVKRIQTIKPDILVVFYKPIFQEEVLNLKRAFTSPYYYFSIELILVPMLTGPQDEASYISAIENEAAKLLERYKIDLFVVSPDSSNLTVTTFVNYLRRHLEKRNVEVLNSLEKIK